MRRWRIILVVVAAAVFAFCYLSFTTHIRWDGGYELTVHMDNQGQPIRAVCCQSMGGRQEDAERALEWTLASGRPESLGMWAAVKERYDDQPVQVRVAVSGRDSYLGLELSRSQFRHLVVVVTYADGTRAGKVVEIPDGRVSREVRVSFP
jgi:hypothetical protein